MRAASSGDQAWRARWTTFSLWLALALLLSGCTSELPWRTPRAPASTPFPTVPPSPRPGLVTSDELYRDDERTLGETRSDHASLPVGAVLPPAPSGDAPNGVSVVLDARTVLRGQLYQAENQPQPGILILGPELAAWDGFPRRLSQAGFVVLVIEAPAATQARQIELLLQSLIAIVAVDAGRIGVVGEGAAADLALLACAVNSLCDALALLSPTARDTSLNMLASYGARPLLLAASRADAASWATSTRLQRAAVGEVVLLETDGGSGPGLLRSLPGTGDQLIAWLSLHLVIS